MLGTATTALTVFVSRMIVGVVKQTVTLARAAVSDVCEGEERALAFGNVMMTVSLAFVIGTVSYCTNSFLRSGYQFLHWTGYFDRPFSHHLLVGLFDCPIFISRGISKAGRSFSVHSNNEGNFSYRVGCFYKANQRCQRNIQEGAYSLTSFSEVCSLRLPDSLMEGWSNH
jgi:hypothetical protein